MAFQRGSSFAWGLIIATTAAIAWSRMAAALELCDDPEMYKVYCSNGGSGARPAGAHSTFTDAFNLNSASLPTEPSSYGFESIGSYLRSDSTDLGGNFALIKGFHRFGTGISTSSNNTFYGDDVVERLYGPPNVTSFSPNEQAQGHLMNLNLGTSVLLLDPSDGPRVQLGISIRYNNITNTWGGGPGLMASWGRFSIGAGFTQEKVSNYLPELIFGNLQVSARVSILEFEYNLLVNDANMELSIPYQNALSPIQVFTVSARQDRVMITAAVRFLNYESAGNVMQTHFALQYMFSKHFAAGLLYNYVPGANSVGTQIFL